MKLMVLLHLKSQIVFGWLTLMTLVVSSWKIYSPSKRFWSLTKFSSSLQQYDVSPLKDRGILKTIISEGNSSLMPSYGDTVTVKLERLDDSGQVITHPDLQSVEDYKISFGIGQDQEIFNGIHYGVLSMSQGEFARLDFSSAYANPTIAKNVSCRVTLLEVKPRLHVPDSHSLDRDFNEVTTGSVNGEADNVHAVFKAQLNANDGQNPLVKEIYKGIKSKDKPPSYYDPAKHKLDPRRELDGEGSDHTWSENIETIDVYVPLPSQIIAKSDISVIIK